MPRRLVLEFEDSPDPGQLLTIEEQREVLSCYRERAMNGHQNAYDLLHITLSERFCPQVDGADQQ